MVVHDYSSSLKKEEKSKLTMEELEGVVDQYVSCRVEEGVYWLYIFPLLFLLVSFSISFHLS